MEIIDNIINKPIWKSEIKIDQIPCQHDKGWFASEWFESKEKNIHEGYLVNVFKITKVRCSMCLEEKELK